VLTRDSWHDFLSRNGFRESNPPQVDKPMVTERKPTPVPYNVLLPRPKPESPTSLPKAMPKQTEVAKATTQKTRAKTGVNTRGKKNARLISRMARNKSKLPVKTEPIVVSEDSDSDIERFLAEEYPYSEGTYLLVCGITLTFLVLNHSMKPSGNHQNPLLFSLLLHLAINVGYGLKDTIWMYLHCNPGSTIWKTKWQSSLVRMQRCNLPIRSNEPRVQSCSKTSSLPLQLSIQN
jgi:hypothetical protein